MKTSLLSLLVAALPMAVPAQSAQSTQPMGAAGQPGQAAGYTATERGANHCVWQRAATASETAGQATPMLHRYTEMATGLNYRDANGEWTEAKEMIEPFPGGAVARQGQVVVTFANDLATEGAINMQAEDGTFRSHVLGLAYFDSASGKSVWIATVTNCQGVIVPPNALLYRDAFCGLKASVVFRYTRRGLSQEIVLLERPHPLPEAFGMNSASTRLQVLTEFIAAPVPVKSAALIPGGAQSEDLLDESLDFGVIKIGAGKAFTLGDGSDPAAPTFSVAKQWSVLDGGQQVLIEEIAILAVAEQLDKLPLPRQARLEHPRRPEQRMATLHRTLPPALKPRPTGTNAMQLAKLTTPLQGFLIDYDAINGSLANVRFASDSTTFLSADVALFGTNNVFEGGATLKFASNVTLRVNAPVTWLGDNFKPVVMTAKDDNRVGESISGSTGNPGTKPYAATALYFDAATAGTNLVVRDLRVANAKTAVALSGKGGHVLSHVQFLNCGNGIAATNTDFSLRNALFYNVKTNFTGSSATGRVEHLTADIATWLNKDIGANLFLTNCLLVAVTNTGSYTPQNVSYAPSAAGVFQTVGAADHYLIDGSTNRCAGTTNITPALLADLGHRTTYPPILYSNVTLATAMTFSPQAQRNTGPPDIGYSYDPLDYIFGGVSASANLTFSAGTAVGWFELPGNGGPGYGISLPDDVTVTFNGTVTAPCVFGRYYTVQEGANANWKDKGWLAGVIAQGDCDPAHPSVVQANFTCFPGLASEPGRYRDYGGALSVCVNNSEFTTGCEGGYVVYSYYTNCLFDRVYIGEQVNAGWAASMTFRNCLFRGGNLVFWHWEGGESCWPSSIRDCAFDRTIIAADAADVDPSYLDLGFLDYDYNAFLVGADRTDPQGANDVLVTDTFNWQTSWLGNYYLPSDSPLIDVGSVSDAALVGLYHFTTQTNETSKELDSQVDIGYHYVAVDAYGNPMDTDGDGVPDYIEDANGNGLVDSGETDWQNASDMGLKVWITEPKSNRNLP